MRWVVTYRTIAEYVHIRPLPRDDLEVYGKEHTIYLQKLMDSLFRICSGKINDKL